jgi:hypothetical protein
MAAALCAASWCFALHAPARLEDVARGAGRIVRGRVVDISAKWVHDGRGRHIYTYATVEVDEYLKGGGKPRLSVELRGGTAGGITEYVSGAASVAKGEEVVLFLRGGSGQVLGGSLGKCALRGEAAYSPLGPMRRRQLLKRVRTVAHGPQAVRRDRTRAVALDPAQMTTDAMVNSRTTRTETTAATATVAETKNLAETWETIKTETFEGTWPNDWALDSDVTMGGEPVDWAPETERPHNDSKSGWPQGSVLDPAESSLLRGGGAIHHRMTYGPFNLSNASDADVTFWLWYELGSGDSMRWQASRDGVTFEGGGITGGTNGAWQQITFDLKDVGTLGNLCGDASVYLRFECEVASDGGSVEGPFIDDIVLRKYATGALPTITSITPSSASAGTGTSVTIEGTGFGATQDTSTVEFFQRSGQPTVPATVSSWSDTSITCTVPETASSGPVVVQTASGTSDGSNFIVTFSYGNKKWDGSAPVIEYYVNENTSDCTGEAAAVQAAGVTWTDANSALSFQYMGSTSATTASQNDVNEAMWVDTLDEFTVGLATTWAYADGTIIEADVQFNDLHYTWDTSEEPSGDVMDVQSVALHEFGHWLRLLDLYGQLAGGVNDEAKVMYGRTTQLNVKRTLHSTDTDGILWIYGPRSTLGITISPSPATWSIGGKPSPGAQILTTTDPDTRFTITNSGTVNETMRLRITDEDDRNTWTAGTAIGENVYALFGLFCANADSPAISSFAAEDLLTTSIQSATSTGFAYPGGSADGVGVAPSDSVYLWFRLDLPNPVTDGHAHNITAEVSCEETP